MVPPFNAMNVLSITAVCNHPWKPHFTRRGKSFSKKLESCANCEISFWMALQLYQELFRLYFSTFIFREALAPFTYSTELSLGIQGGSSSMYLFGRVGTKVVHHISAPSDFKTRDPLSILVLCSIDVRFLVPRVGFFTPTLASKRSRESWSSALTQGSS